VQRSDDVGPLRQRGGRDRTGRDAKPGLPETGRPKLAPVSDSSGLASIASSEPRPCRAEHELVEQRSEVALAGAAIDDERLGRARHGVRRGRSQQSDEVADLLELAPRVGVELAIAGQEVQIFEQLDRHPGGTSGSVRASYGLDCCLDARGTATTRTASGSVSRRPSVIEPRRGRPCVRETRGS